MKQFEIFITSISWKSGSKSRPVLVLMFNDDSVSVFPITTQYDNKSKTIQARYFKMNDWMLSGLAKQSYIDTGTLIKLPLSAIKKKKLIGRLTITEKQRLLEFLSK
ncbi:MAG: hypothetical protein FWD36_08940 [Treponema sp.]|nr:hypothetical protein [Treponema sp.]